MESEGQKYSFPWYFNNKPYSDTYLKQWLLGFTLDPALEDWRNALFVQWTGRAGAKEPLERRMSEGE